MELTQANLEKVANGALVAQGMAMSAHLVLNEILVRYVTRDPNPREALRTMFESINGSLDRQTDKRGGTIPPAVVQAREAIEQLFVGLDRLLAKREAGES